MVGQDIKTQTRRVLDNLKAVLEAGGSSMDRVVKTTIFLKMRDIFDPSKSELLKIELVPKAGTAIRASGSFSVLIADPGGTGKNLSDFALVERADPQHARGGTAGTLNSAIHIHS